MNLIIGLVLFVGLVDGATGKLLLLFVCLFVCLHVVYVVTEFVRYREVHMDTELSCHVPTGTKRWYLRIRNKVQATNVQSLQRTDRITR